MIFEKDIWGNNNFICITSTCISSKEIKCFASQNSVGKS